MRKFRLIIGEITFFCWYAGYIFNLAWFEGQCFKILRYYYFILTLSCSVKLYFYSPKDLLSYQIVDFFFFYRFSSTLIFSSFLLKYLQRASQNPLKVMFPYPFFFIYCSLFSTLYFKSYLQSCIIFDYYSCSFIC